MAESPPEDHTDTHAYMVFSVAGKLLYTSYDGEETWAYTQASVMHAMLSLFDEHEALQRITLAHMHITFLQPKPLYVACLSTQATPDAIVQARLERLYAAILSLMSRARLQRLLARAPNLDLQALIGPMKAYLDCVVHDMHASPALALGTVPVRALDASLRDQLAQTCLQMEARPPQPLYVLLYDQEALLALAHPKRHAPYASDLALVNALVRVCGDHDTWAPLCLPALAPDGFVYVYASRVGRVRVALVCGDPDGYVACRAWRHALATSACMARVPSALSTPTLTAEAMGLFGLRDVVFSSRRTHQCILSSHIPARRRAWMEHVLCALRGPSPRPAPPALQRQPPVPVPLELVIERTEHEAMLGWRTPVFELCISTSPLLASSAIGELANKVVAWIRQNDQRLFATPATF